MLKNKKAFKERKGFTLMEILVTVIIVGVLAAIAYPVFSKSIAKARATEAVNLLEIVKNKQIQNFATTGEYATSLSDLKRLTTGRENLASGVVNDNYYVSLNTEKACASVAYKKSGREIFSFSVGYETPGLGCSGNVCSSFGDIVGTADSVCDVSLPGPGQEEPPTTCTGCPGPQPTCPEGQTGSYTCNMSTCQWEGSCSPISGWCDGMARTCPGPEGKICHELCTGSTWGPCTCEDTTPCTPGSEGQFQDCRGTCKADGSGYECTGDTDTHYCLDANTCLPFDKTCKEGDIQKQTCDDEVTVLCRTFSIRGGWSCEFNTSSCNTSQCPC